MVDGQVNGSLDILVLLGGNVVGVELELEMFCREALSSADWRNFVDA